MSIKEQIKALKAELSGLRAELAAGDAGAKARATQILDVELPALEQKARDAEEFSALIARIGAANAEKGDGGVGHTGGPGKKSLGAHVADFAKSHSGQGRIETPEWVRPAKAAGDTHVVPPTLGEWLTEHDGSIVEGFRRTSVLDLFGVEEVSGDSYSYLVEGALEGGFTAIGEGDGMSQLHFADPTPKTVTLGKIAGYYNETEELLDDAAFLASSIDNRALWLYDMAEESQVLSGDGTGDNLTGLLNTSGIQTVTVAKDKSDYFDMILKAAMNIQKVTGFAADGIVISPDDFYDLRIAKDDNKQYLAGGPFVGAYGNATAGLYPNIWTLPTRVSAAVSAGTFIVGAFRAGGAIKRKRGAGVTVELTNSHGENFTRDVVTVKIKGRLGLAIRRPSCFVKGTVATS